MQDAPSASRVKPTERLRAHQFRLKPDPMAVRYLFGFADARRWVWNECVRWMEEANFVAKAGGARWPDNQAFSLETMGQLLDEWIKANPWLKLVPKQLIQQALLDFIKARSAFLSRAVKRPPRFQKARKAVPTMRFPQHVRLNQDAVFLPKIGWVKYRNSFNKGRGIPDGKLRSATVRFVNGRWVVSLLFRVQAAKVSSTSINAVGIDCGVANTLALSSRINLHAPLMTDPEACRIRFLERRVARCSFGSVRRAQAQLRLNRFRSRINRRIHDWRHKTTTALSKNHGLIAVEDLALKNMTASAKGSVEAPGTNVAQKSGINRALLEPGFGIIFQLLEYKQQDRGHAFIRVNPAHTSQTCPECQHVHPDNRPSRGSFRCQQCGHVDEADFAAARNVLRRAQILSLADDSALAAGLGRDCAPVALATRAHRGSHPRTKPSSRLAA